MTPYGEIRILFLNCEPLTIVCHVNVSHVFWNLKLNVIININCNHLVVVQSRWEFGIYIYVIYCSTILTCFIYFCSFYFFLRLASSRFFSLSFIYIFSFFFLRWFGLLNNMLYTAHFNVCKITSRRCRDIQLKFGLSII